MSRRWGFHESRARPGTGADAGPAPGPSPVGRTSVPLLPQTRPTRMGSGLTCLHPTPTVSAAVPMHATVSTQPRLSSRHPSSDLPVPTSAGEPFSSCLLFQSPAEASVLAAPSLTRHLLGTYCAPGSVLGVQRRTRCRTGPRGSGAGQAGPVAAALAVRTRPCSPRTASSRGLELRLLSPPQASTEPANAGARTHTRSFHALHLLMCH